MFIQILRTLFCDGNDTFCSKNCGTHDVWLHRPSHGFTLPPSGKLAEKSELESSQFKMHSWAISKDFMVTSFSSLSESLGKLRSFNYGAKKQKRWISAYTFMFSEAMFKRLRPRWCSLEVPQTPLPVF